MSSAVEAKSPTSDSQRDNDTSKRSLVCEIVYVKILSLEHYPSIERGGRRQEDSYC